jgi:hypothetical protein
MMARTQARCCSFSAAISDWLVTASPDAPRKKKPQRATSGAVVFGRGSKPA